MKSRNFLFTTITFITLTLNFAFGQNCKLINSATFTVPDSPPSVILSGTLHRFPNDTVPLNLNQWNYVAMVIGTNQYQIYLNGTLAYQGIYSSSGMSWYQLHLGAHYYTEFGSWFDGWMDEFRISNTVRSAATISNYYSSGTPFINDANTIGLWHFDQTTGSQINSAIGPIGTLGNAKWDSNGKFGNCLYFNGTNAVSTMDINIPINNMTCEFWIKPHSIKYCHPVDWYGMNTSGLRLDVDTISAKYTWSTGATGNSITVNPKEYTYIAVTNGICYDTVYLTPQSVNAYDTLKIYDTIRKYNNEIRFLKFKSYYSADDGQVNVYEIQAYNNGKNVALNKSGYANSYQGGDFSSNGSKAVDGNGGGFSRWSSNRNDLGPDSLYPHFIVIDLGQKIAVDSIMLNIKGGDSWKQTFDFDVSSDALYWRNVGKGNNTTGIFTYYPKMPFVVYDTLHFAVYEKVFVSVTDTLIINSVITSIIPPNNINIIKIFPNPAKDHITIDYGNYAMQTGYKIKIINSLGQVVFTTLINQQESYVDLSSWTAKGIYYVHLIDAQNKTVELRKIVLQ